jgi:acyl-homoserine lactone synthase
MFFHLVTRENEHNFQIELDAFFEARHRVYAEELGWVPSSPDGREIDRFDTAAAAYLIVMDGEEFVAGSRLVPTHLPHLLSEVFPDSCSLIPMPRDPKILEWTRGFVVASRRGGNGGFRLLAQCCAAVMEYSLSMGYRQVGGIQDVKWLATWKRMGWNVRIHGDPIDIGGEAWLPAYFDVSEAALAGARRLGKVQGPLLDLGSLDEAA